MGCGNTGIFESACGEISSLGSGAWTFLITLVIIVGSLGALFAVLQGTAAVSIGGGGMASRALLGGLGVLVMVFVAFAVIPVLAAKLTDAAPSAPWGGGDAPSTPWGGDATPTPWGGDATPTPWGGDATVPTFPIAYLPAEWIDVDGSHDLSSMATL